MKKISKMYHITHIFLYVLINTLIIKLLYGYIFGVNAV